MGNRLSRKEEKKIIKDSSGSQEYDNTEKPITNDILEGSTADKSPDSQTCLCDKKQRTSVDLQETSDDVQFVQLILHLQQTSETSESFKSRDKEVTLPYPRTGRHLKQLIEDQLQIPACVQRLFFHSQPVLDKQCLLPLYLRDGDVITIEYTTQADLKSVAETVQLMRDVSDFLESNKDGLRSPTPSLDATIQDLLKPQLVESLVRNYFFRQGSEKVVTNQLYFVHSNGIEVTAKLHKVLSSFRWDQMSIEMQYMERAVLIVLWNLSCTLGVRCLLLEQPNLFNQLSVSILRQKTFPYQKVLAPTKQQAAMHASVQNLNNILIETMFKGMGVITNLSEVPSCQLEIASKPKMIEQLISAMLSPSFSVFCSHIIISTFLNLSYCPQTHHYLTSPMILHGIVEACKRHSNQYLSFRRSINEFDIIIIRYFGTLFFSLICTTSDEFATSEGFKVHSTNVLVFMQKFLKDYTSEQVREAEKTAGYYWSTLKPFINLLYFSYEKHLDSKLVKEKPVLRDLYLVSLRSGIFLLQNACVSEDNIDVLVKEGLIDFITCLPWYVTGELRDEAHTAVQLMSQKRKLEPPSLLNIAKARLASWSIPMEDVMSPNFLEKIYRHFT